MRKIHLNDMDHLVFASVSASVHFCQLQYCYFANMTTGSVPLGISCNWDYFASSLMHHS